MGNAYGSIVTREQRGRETLTPAAAYTAVFSANLDEMMHTQNRRVGSVLQKLIML